MHASPSVTVNPASVFEQNCVSTEREETFPFWPGYCFQNLVTAALKLFSFKAKE